MLPPDDKSPGESAESHTDESTAVAVASELRELLEADESLLGEVFRRTAAGESPEQIRAARGAARPNFVWNYLRTIDALIENDLPIAPSVARQTAHRFRSLLRQKQLSPLVRTELERRLTILEERAADLGARKVEDAQAVEATSLAEENAVPGIYVYALPHYVRHPYDEDSGHTLLKVGRADRSVIQRFRSQTRTTALPEDPVLLRVYPCDEGASTELERREWFLTSVRFLDEIAVTLRLEVREITQIGEILE
jgi:hypothetical protein